MWKGVKLRCTNLCVFLTVQIFQLALLAPFGSFCVLSCTRRRCIRYKAMISRYLELTPARSHSFSVLYLCCTPSITQVFIEIFRTYICQKSLLFCILCCIPLCAMHHIVPWNTQQTSVTQVFKEVFIHYTCHKSLPFCIVYYTMYRTHSCFALQCISHPWCHCSVGIGFNALHSTLMQYTLKFPS